MVKMINRLRRKEQDNTPKAASADPQDIKLLHESRHQLKNRPAE